MMRLLGQSESSSEGEIVRVNTQTGEVAGRAQEFRGGLPPASKR